MKVKIARLISLYGVIQSIILFAVFYFFHLSKYSFYAFFMFNLLWHLVVYFYLVSHTDAFYKTETAEQLDDINLANVISLFRASAIMPVGYLIWFSQENRAVLYCAIIYAALIFLTDTVDGFIARKLHETTQLGEMIDSMCDYALLIFISGLFYERKILPLWFFILLFIRLFAQAYGMVKFIALGFPMEPVSTIGGKITIASTMILYFVALLSMLIDNPVFTRIVDIYVLICAALIFIFLFEKLGMFFKHWKKFKAQK